MGTNNDDSQLAYHQYNVKQGSASILNSAGGTIDGRTDPSGTDPDGDPDYLKFEITQADIEKNFPAIDLDDEPTWLDFVVVFEGSIPKTSFPIFLKKIRFAPKPEPISQTVL